MPVNKFSNERSLAIIKENEIIKALCTAEQEGHRTIISQLRLLQKHLRIKEPKSWLPRMRVNPDRFESMKKAIEDEMNWRKCQIIILECDRNAAHNTIKYHTRKLEEASKEKVSG